MAGSWSKLYHAQMRSPGVLAAVSQAGGAALGLHLEALAWCGEYLTDGRLTAGQVGRLICYRPEAVQALISAGLWVQAEDGALSIVGYLDEQESAADVIARRKDWRDEYRSRRKLAAQQRRQQPAGPRAAERPAGPSDHVAPGVPCGRDWCDGSYHYTRDPDDDRVPRAERSSWACPQGPRASSSRRTA